MAQFSKAEVEAQLMATRVVPLFYYDEVDVCKKIVDACYAGGARVLEFTNRGDNAFHVFSQMVPYVRAEYEDMAIGCGSILDAVTTQKFIDAGADFIVSPALDTGMGELCEQENILWSPGCGTLTEIVAATKIGAPIVKVFPAGALGPSFLKAVRGPCPWLQLMPTGGVSPENLTEWFQAGAVCVGMGSKLIKKELVEAGAFEALAHHISATLQKAHSLTKA